MGMNDIEKFSNPATENIIDSWNEWNVYGEYLAQINQADAAWLDYMRQKVGELIRRACMESFSNGYHAALKDQEIMGRNTRGT